jgi:hypothetical protein
MEVFMLKHYVATPLLCFFLGGISLSASSGYNSNNSSQPSNYYQNNNSSQYYNSRNSYPNVRPGVSNGSSNFPNSQRYQNKRKKMHRRKEIAYNALERDIHRRANRMGDWGYRENWRYDSRAFFKGETQPEAYEQEYPYGPGGIGYDPDVDYLQMRKFYEEDVERKHQDPVSSVNQGNSNNRSNNSSNRGYYKNSSTYYQSNANHNNNKSSDGRKNVSNSSYANDQRNHQSSATRYANNSYRREKFNNEIGYINQTNPGYPYYNDPDNNRQYDWSKQNTPRDYRSGSMNYSPYYNQEDNLANGYYYYYY